MMQIEDGHHSTHIHVIQSLLQPQNLSGIFNLLPVSTVYKPHSPDAPLLLGLQWSEC